MKKIYFLLLAALAASGCVRGPVQPAGWVDPFVGTGGHGHTFPGATLPFGLVQLSPDTRRGNWDACAGYHYSDSTLLGFSHTHLSGTGCADLADVLFHPTTSEAILGNEEYAFKPHAFSHDHEQATPGYYSVYLREAGIRAELTATTRVGVHRYTYDKGLAEKLIIDMGHLLDDEAAVDSIVLRRTGPDEVSGMRRVQGWAPDRCVYFVARFSKDIVSADFIGDGIDASDTIGLLNPGQYPRQMMLHFGVSDGRPLVAKVGLSLVSEENARQNMHGEVSGFDFDSVVAAARKSWDTALSDITVEGGTPTQMKNFYTACYHAKIVPNVMNDLSGEYRRQDGSVGKLPVGERHYSTFSLWDTFRAWHPLVTLTDTTFVAAMVRSLIDMYEHSPRRELPIWPLWAGETETMIGYHSIPVIVDAYLKGVRGFDADKALEAMKHSSQINRKGAEYYLRYGYIPSEMRKESVSCLLEFAYDDWCIAQMARALGQEEDYRTYVARARSYATIFDPQTGFFRPKRLDGSWEGTLNPYAPDRAYTEATPWQYRFFVPHDVGGLMQLMGGRELFAAALDSLFTADARIDGEMEDITGLIGQYAHGNEPSHHIAYLYNYAAQPWKTQSMTRRILDEMYRPAPDGISGNEDCGQMSAWYIFTSLGLYPVCPGSDQLLLTSPLFPKATIKLANGKTLIIKANSPPENVYIKECRLNGKPIEENYVTFASLMEGGTLEFILSPQPCYARGIRPQDMPYSLRDEGTDNLNTTE